jgi:glycosyltransferase involved in cell wall biosynthesis
VRWSAFGNGDRAWLDRLRSVGVEVRGYYRTGSLPELLVRERVDVALALSVVPESYGLVLDECRAAGVPVVAFAHGALAERLVRVGAGRTVTLADGAAGVAAALAAPFAPVPAPEPFDATDAHLGLYRELGIL